MILGWSFGGCLIGGVNQLGGGGRVRGGEQWVLGQPQDRPYRGTRSPGLHGGLGEWLGEIGQAAA